MKYIGSGLWALAAAHLEVAGSSFGMIFYVIALMIAVMASNKSLVTINNQAAKGGE